MNGTVCVEKISRIADVGEVSQLTELVRGNDHRLLEEIEPLLRRQSVSLDLSAVERIDAAGIAALISLYRIAQESGHAFNIAKASVRVAEMLALVGLDGILLSHHAKRASRSRSRLAENAA
jgi:anti-anti-sigma factor